MCFRHKEVDGCKLSTFKLGQKEMLVLGPKKQRDLLLNLTINLNGCTVVSNKTVKDLGVTLDRKSTRLNSSHSRRSRMPSSA